MFENPRRGRQARNFTTNAPKILDLKSSSEQIFSRKLPLGAPVVCVSKVVSADLMTLVWTISCKAIPRDQVMRDAVIQKLSLRFSISNG